MTTVFHTKNYTIGDGFKNALEKKLKRIGKLVDKDATITVTCTREGNTKTLDIAVSSKGKFYNAQESGEKMFARIEGTVSKVIAQIVKDKDKKLTKRTSKTKDTAEKED